MSDNSTMYCGRCGTLLQRVKTHGRDAKICPHCFPEKALQLRTRPCNKTNKPCDDRGVCKPAECLIGLTCDDGRRHKRKGLRA